ncbi:hypothetical protein BAUCODRAFT_562488 [Baudoinia panamericana UAMH 10762]|uniref:Uncharacterized protein n=1 Tax=Baudoinia panamericana (strain UAMH 10762) TaxID=717646 RepID=M2N6U6_BAUPA|nr:uncharacterized protein BAUCODRAFT_562488 [Baudoinia panamericana UAMH 10762]EMC94809.1 hypothetical protein BAUCODRAFT_562488 [Baudoinia panamericana UAMH 10762]
MLGPMDRGVCRSRAWYLHLQQAHQNWCGDWSDYGTLLPGRSLFCGGRIARIRHRAAGWGLLLCYCWVCVRMLTEESAFVDASTIPASI